MTQETDTNCCSKVDRYYSVNSYGKEEMEAQIYLSGCMILYLLNKMLKKTRTFFQRNRRYSPLLVTS